ncbi:MAG: hypothetical protein GWN07_34110, partial [Actinobacteria bacterium]|nr:hypothetical protein [Actinomycetota bacterium]NIS35846.1 hypothetical protein [Actinomycetota bacterium]NIT98377.1 hypothetical protein [Actinomycetota bacterium]NIW32359.1 hypothetical protein [Actinomycetota bacterium]NIX24568.1 hypothetical protein [Actinomycetota bacterium]
HRDLTVVAAGELHRTLRSLEAGGCSALRQAFSGAMALAQERIDAGHAELDAATPRRLVGA